MNNGKINDILTVSEIADIIKKDTSSVRRILINKVDEGQLIEGVDFRKAKNIWLVDKRVLKKFGWCKK